MRNVKPLKLFHDGCIKFYFYMFKSRICTYSVYLLLIWFINIISCSCKNANLILLFIFLLYSSMETLYGMHFTRPHNRIWRIPLQDLDPIVQGAAARVCITSWCTTSRPNPTGPSGMRDFPVNIDRWSQSLERSEDSKRIGFLRRTCQVPGSDMIRCRHSLP